MTWPVGWTVLPSLVAGFDAFTSGISNDGNVICGYANDADGNSHAVYWTFAGGIVDLGFLPDCNQSLCDDLSQDGSVIVGFCIPILPGVIIGFKWTQLGGMTTIAPDVTSGSSLSDDGSVIGVSTGGDSRSAIWTSGGGLVLIPTTGTDTSNPAGVNVSPNGVHVAVVGNPSSDWVTWTQAGGSVNLGVSVAPAPLNAIGNTPLIDNDGNGANSGANSPGGVTTAFVQVAAPVPIFTQLGLLPGGTQSVTLATVVDGTLVVGYADDSMGNLQAVYWTPIIGQLTEIPPPDGFNTFSNSGLNRSVQPNKEAFVGQFLDGSDVSNAVVYVFPASDININLTGVEAVAAVTAPTTVIIAELTLTDLIVQTIPGPSGDNQITLRWSDDAGASWSNGLLKSLGHTGEYYTTPTWYRLGMSRNRIIELSWSGAHAEALQGVFLEVTIAAT